MFQLTAYLACAIIPTLVYGQQQQTANPLSLLYYYQKEEKKKPDIQVIEPPVAEGAITIGIYC